MGHAQLSRGLTVTKHNVKWPDDPCHPRVTVFTLLLATVNSRWGNWGPEKGRAPLSAPSVQTRRAADTHLELCQGQSPALAFTMSPHPPRQRGSGSDGQGSSSEVAAWPQPSPQPGRLWVLASSQLFPAFPVSEQTPAPMSQVLGHCSSLLVAEARMDVEQGPDWARMLGTTPSSGI